MRRKRSPLDGVDPEEKEAKAKVSMVLQVLSGEKTIAEACRETGLKPIKYYKLEERMVQAMVATAKMPALRGKRKDPMTEMNDLATQTTELRQEHRRLQSLMRITRKLVSPKKRGPGRPPKAANPPTVPAETAHRRAPIPTAAQG